MLCAGGLGDGLLMMITAHNLRKQGREVTVYHTLHQTLSPLFPDHTFSPYPENTLSHFANYDQVVLQNDNSKRAWEIMQGRTSLKDLRVFFPTACKLSEKNDYLFPKRQAIGKSIADATAKLLAIDTPYMDNGLITPEGTFRKHKTRIAIHPTSADPKRNWTRKKFTRLARKLERDGYEIAFVMSEKEREEWLDIAEYGFALPKLSTLKETARYIYESGYLIGNDSGLGHLASNLGVPTLTISGNPKRVALWRPSWTKGKVATIPFELPNFKGIGFRFRDHFWQYFVRTGSVYRLFRELSR